MRCPGCDVDMQDKELDKVPVTVCPQCSGVVVAQNKLVPLLTTLSKSLLDIDIDTALQPLDAPHLTCNCPKCRRTMTSFGYAGSPLVKANRCAECWHVWATADEIGLMAALFLRTQKRVDQRQRMFDRMAESMANTDPCDAGRQARVQPAGDRHAGGHVAVSHGAAGMAGGHCGV